MLDSQFKILQPLLLFMSSRVRTENPWREYKKVGLPRQVQTINLRGNII